MTRGPFLESPEKPSVKLRPAYSVKVVYSCVVKEIKITMTAKFGASRLVRFEDTKRIMSLEMRPERFGALAKRSAGPNCSIGCVLSKLIDFSSGK